MTEEKQTTLVVGELRFTLDDEASAVINVDHIDGSDEFALASYAEQKGFRDAMDGAANGAAGFSANHFGRWGWAVFRLGDTVLLCFEGNFDHPSAVTLTYVEAGEIAVRLPLLMAFTARGPGETNGEPIHRPSAIKAVVWRSAEEEAAARLWCELEKRIEPGEVRQIMLRRPREHALDVRQQADAALAFANEWRVVDGAVVRMGHRITVQVEADGQHSATEMTRELLADICARMNGD